MVNYENFYNGADSALIPSYNPVGYQIDVGEIGTALDPRTANQLGEVNHKMNPGVKTVEVQGVSADVLESIPDQHLDELKRLMKLTGVNPSFHAPIIEASGVGEKGWNEETRESAERQLKSAVLRSHKLDPEGNISVTVHSTAQLPEMRPVTKTEDGKIKEGPFWVIDPDSGQIGQLPREKRYFPEEGKFEGKEMPFEPEKELAKLNNDQWMSQLSDINRYSNYGEEIISKLKTEGRLNPEVLSKLKQGFDAEQFKGEEEKSYLKNLQKDINHGQIYLRDSYRNMKSLFDKAYASSKGEDKERLSGFAKWAAPIVENGIENDPEKLEKFSEVIERGLKTLGAIKSPQKFQELNNFVVDKSAETFANIATSSFEKFGNTTPIINIENPPAGGGLSKAEDLKELIESSRDKLKQNLIKKGMGKSEAKQTAEKLIGATWDIGHINMLRKQGYTKEDIIKQTKTIAPFVKHVHLSDNFGMEHTELPMGMGNVPTKEILKELKKKGFKGKKIVEAGNWWQHFADKGGGNPIYPTLQNFDSPLYSSGTGPTWSQLGGYGTYFSGQGAISPQVHHSLYGAGFSNLPQELGGEIPGTQSRFSGTPNQ